MKLPGFLRKKKPAQPPLRTAWGLVPPRQLFERLDRADWESECRRLTFNAYLGDDTVLCRVLARFKMFVSTKDKGLGPHLIGDGYWEMWTTKVMTQLIQPGMVCIDAGANIGYYTLLMADLAWPDGKVVAAEPIPGTRSLLQRNVNLNGFDGVVDVLDVALGARQGEVTLFMPPGDPKNAQICDHAPHPDWEGFKAPLKPIDDLGLTRVDFVKIDVEGAEMEVWRGMQKTIRNNPQIQIMMEVNCVRYRAEAESFLTEISALFPLRLVDFSSEHLPTSIEEVLTATDDVMLYLTREPVLDAGKAAQKG